MVRVKKEEIRGTGVTKGNDTEFYSFTEKKKQTLLRDPLGIRKDRKSHQIYGQWGYKGTGIPGDKWSLNI